MMNEGVLFSKRFVFTSIILVFVVSPFLAWSIRKAMYKPPKPLKVDSSYVQSVITKETGKKYVVTSVENIENWWYVVKLYEAGGPQQERVAVLSNFNSKDPAFSISVKPGEKLVQKNISGFGLPYSVVESIVESNGE